MSYKSLAVNFFFCSIICYGQQLDNAGFEQWENVGSSDEEPIEWSSTKTSDNSSLNALAPQVNKLLTGVLHPGKRPFAADNAGP